jgi:hypothetical protein
VTSPKISKVLKSGHFVKEIEEEPDFSDIPDAVGFKIKTNESYHSIQQDE